ncbi:TspO/MBR family protein [Tardiphaga sp.]|uniref:TspO/MBR family protein n=1 Tax=Tardiphaga sp. TaxID=1926292 RepID=UPI002634C440|nr:TspO/MBR family protein [Tardiphaga sp.]MDB5621222.1 tryptophan-rich sensory protein [Tardiphaga sp.]
MTRYLVLGAFLAIVLGGGMAIGYTTRPGAWFAALAKPSFNPPGWLFAPAWTILYVLIAIAGWRTFLREPIGLAMAVWTLQLVLNFLWSPTFFGAHRPDAALFVIAALLASIVAFIAIRWSVDRTAALLFLPYAAWVIFATALNAAIWQMNR